MPNKPIQNISVIGDGGWGTTIAIHLSKKGYNVTLWGPFPQYIKRLAKNRYNSKFLPGIRIPKETIITDDLTQAVDTADLIVFAVPSKFAGTVIKNIKQTKIKLNDKYFLSLTKGLDQGSLKRISELIESTLKIENVAVLSGPNIASEIAKGVPSMAVIANKNRSIAKKLQEVLSTETFRMYTNTDVIGIELGGTTKNVMALACGICDGLGYGTNTKAALLTRGLAEMTEFATALGARAKTFAGLSGLGDLVTTAFSQKSRNRTVGEQLGKGQTLTHIIKKMEMVAEGVETAKSVYKLSRKLDIEMPITHEVYDILYKEKSPKKAVISLMTRELKSE